MITTGPHCSVKIKAPDHAAGRRVNCPECKQRFIVAAPPQAVEPPLDTLEVIEKAPTAPTPAERVPLPVRSHRWLWWAVSRGAGVVVVGGVLLAALLLDGSIKNPPKEVAKFLTEAKAGIKLLESGCSYYQACKMVDRLSDLHSRLPDRMPGDTARLARAEVLHWAEQCRRSLEPQPDLFVTTAPIVIELNVPRMRKAIDEIEAAYRQGE
jgi:hypothetical protein